MIMWFSQDGKQIIFGLLNLFGVMSRKVILLRAVYFHSFEGHRNGGNICLISLIFDHPY